MAIEIVARTRKTQGTGASRRLRREGKVPGIVYGGDQSAVTIELDHNPLYHAVRDEKFHASILNLKLDDKVEQVVLRAVNMHPWQLQVQHIDFQRVSAQEKIHMKVPLHFVNADISPAVKVSGGMVSHVMNEVDVRCLPADLPEFILVDLADITIGHSIHVSDLKLPKGVEVPLRAGENPSVATAQIPRAAIAEEEEAAAAAAAAAAAGEGAAAPGAEAAPAASEVPAAKQPAKPEAPAEEKKGGKGETFSHESKLARRSDPRNDEVTP